MEDLASQDILRPPCRGGGVGKDFQQILVPPKYTFPILLHQKDALIERLMFDRHLETKPSRFWRGEPLQSAVYTNKNQLFRF